MKAKITAENLKVSRVPAKIKIENLNVSYEKHAVLKGVSLEIPEKKITVIIGSSGCGKTTLLKTLNRLTDIVEGVKTTGRVRVDGKDVFGNNADVNSIRKKMGFISQTPNPLPMSIYDNITYGPRIHGTRGKGELDAIVERCLRSAGLWNELKGRLKEPATRLSVGQQQRLCLARALAVEPEIILCDEPTSALDPISARHIEEELLALKKDYTIVFVTHILRQAKRLADYAVFMNIGEIVEQGDAKKVFEKPSDPRTRAYIKGEFS
ncbi:MAG: phosphate ABC transporter ATP-binding protein [Candidatus Diapherotrites archaeon]